MFRAVPHPSSGAYNCISSLWFYRWSVAVAALLVVVRQESKSTLRGDEPKLENFAKNGQDVLVFIHTEQF
jgi:hypothetical protein